jgi:PAS domain S-box-containing protein
MNTKPGQAITAYKEIGDIGFRDLFDLEEIQRLQDLFSDTNGVASIITHPDGTPITKPSNFCRLCSNIIRKTEKGLENCYQSDAILGRMSLSGAIVQPCLSSGLWDAGAGITLNGKNIANWLIGQVRNEETDERQMLLYADEIGANKEEFMAALKEVPVMSGEQFKKTSDLLFAFARELSEKAALKLQLKQAEKEQHQAKATILEKEWFNNRIVETANEGIWALDADHNTTYLNGKMAEMLGYSAEEVMQLKMTNFMFSEDMDDLRLKRSQRMAGKSGFYERRFKRKNGDVLWTLVSSTAIIDNKGTFQGSLGMILDITERKNTEELLRQSEEKFRLIAENTSETIAVLDMEFHFIYVTPAVPEMLGYSQEEALNLTLEKLLTPDSVRKIHELAEEILPAEYAGTPRSGNYPTIELEEYHKNGTTIWVELSFSLIKDQNGKPNGIITVSRDITERKHLEAQRIQQLHFTSALNSIAEIIILKENREEILEETNRIIGETLNLDRILIYDVSFEKNNLIALCEWLKQGYPEIEPTRGEYPLELFLDPFTHIRKSGTYLTSQFDHVNEYYSKDGSGKILHEHFKIKSLVWYPFAFYEHGYYVFTLNQILDQRQWLKEEFDFLESVAKQVSLALMKIKLLEERKLAEEELKESEIKYRLIAENTSDGIIIFSADSKIEYASPSYVRQLGYSLSEEEGRTAESIYSIIHSEDREEVFAKIYAAIESKKSGLTYLYRVMHKAGHYIWREDHANFNYDATGSYTGACVVCRDVTERMRSESDIQKIAQHYQAIIDKAPDGIVLINAEGNFKFVSPAARKLFGYSKNEVITGNPSESTHPDDLPMVLAELYHVMTDREYVPIIQYRFRDHSGDWRWVESTMSNLLDDPSVEAIVINFRDITDRKQAQLEILELNQQLDQRVKQRTAELESAIKELETFSYSVSHDLKAPLRHISGFIGLFLESTTAELTEEERGFLARVTDAAAEMAKLIDAILSFSRLNQADIRKTNIDMSKMAREVINFFEPEIKDRKIIFNLGLLPGVMGDENLIRQVWTNLISNAIKYTGKKAEGVIEIGCNSSANEITYFVKDNGAGFNMKYAEKLFGVFKRLHKTTDFEGIGIGLANVNRIVKRHGGHCRAEGEPDQGATFYFSLPI